MQTTDHPETSFHFLSDIACLKKQIENGELESIKKYRTKLVDYSLEHRGQANATSILLSKFNHNIVRAVLDIFIKKYSWLEECVWLEFGSGGREEQVLGSDQDNGLLWINEPDEFELEEVCQRMVMTLDGCGLPLCTGQVMLNNPEWRGSLETWQDRVKKWLHNPEEKGPWQSGMFLDFVAISPKNKNLEIAKILRSSLHQQLHEHPLGLSILTRKLLDFSPPLTFWGSFVLEKSGPYQGSLNFKNSILSHIVNASRILCLKYGLESRNTWYRLLTLQQEQHINSKMGDSLQKLYEFIQYKRLEQGLLAIKKGEHIHNYIRPYDLAKKEILLLKQGIKETRNFLNLVLSGAEI